MWRVWPGLRTCVSNKLSGDMVAIRPWRASFLRTGSSDSASRPDQQATGGARGYHVPAPQCEPARTRATRGDAIDSAFLSASPSGVAFVLPPDGEVSRRKGPFSCGT